jgi:hypothetical protein
MTNLDQVKVTPRNQQVLNLLVQGCSNKEIGGQLNISPHTVKQHLRTLFLRAGIFDGPKRVKLKSGVGWNWQCTCPAMAERIGFPRSSAIILATFAALRVKQLHVLVMFGQRSYPKVAHLMPQSSGVVVK